METMQGSQGLDRQKTIHPSMSKRARLIIQFGSIEKYCQWSELDSRAKAIQLDLKIMEEKIRNLYGLVKNSKDLPRFKRKFSQ